MAKREDAIRAATKGLSTTLMADAIADRWVRMFNIASALGDILDALVKVGEAGNVGSDGWTRLKAMAAEQAEALKALLAENSGDQDGQGGN